jgi:hypothetical protein
MKYSEKYDLSVGAEVLIDYNSQNNQDIIDVFEEESNLEGFATILKIDEEEGLLWFEGMPLSPVSFEYVCAIDLNTNEMEELELFL